MRVSLKMIYRFGVSYCICTDVIIIIFFIVHFSWYYTVVDVNLLLLPVAECEMAGKEK